MTEPFDRRQLIRGRSRARSKAVQALYQWQIAGHEVSEIEQQFLAEEDMSAVDVSYFHELLQRVVESRGELDEVLRPHVSRSLDTLDPVERAILWLGSYELVHRHDVPGRVVINEAVNLAKAFGAEDGHRFVNGVLDKVARTLRSSEMSG